MSDLPSSPMPEADYPDEAEVAAIRRGLLLGRSFFFFYFVAVAAFFAYINVYFESLGFSGTQIGWIAGVTPLVGLAATPLWSAAADTRQWHKPLLAAATLGVGLLSLLMLGVTSYWIAFAASVLIAIFRAPIIPVLDSVVVTLTQRIRVSYPRQRVWGSVGFSAGSFVTAFLIARAGYDVIFWVQFVCMGVIGTALALMLPIERTGERVDYLRGLRLFVAQPAYRGLLVYMLALGITTSAWINFGGLNILALGGASAAIGIAYTLTTIVEIPAMLGGDYTVRRLGQRGTIVLCGIGVALLFMLAALATQAWHFILAMAAQGIFTGIVWSAAAPYSMQGAPANLRASATGIMFATFSGAGFAVGALVSGYLWDALGGSVLYLASGVVMMVGALYFLYSTRRTGSDK